MDEDYPATLAGIPSFQFDCFQAVMNAAARLVFQSSRRHPAASSPALATCTDRISYKLAVLVFQCTHGLGPVYLTDTLQPVAGIRG